MPSKNRRIATYLPPFLENHLKEFIIQRNIRGESAALIQILSEYFGVTRQVAQEVEPKIYVTLNQFEELSDQVQALAKTCVEESSTSSSQSELLVELSQLQDALAEVKASQSRLQHKVDSIAASLPRNDEWSTGSLAKRLNVDSSTLSHWKSSGPKGKSPENLLKDTRLKDPEGIGWIFNAETNKFRPERPLGELPVAHQIELPQTGLRADS